MDNEPTVLDYLKSLLRGKPLPIPPAPAPSDTGVPELSNSPAEMASAPLTPELFTPPARRPPVSLPWRGWIALGLALLAQLSLEPRPERGWIFGAVLYFVAAVWLIWANSKGDWPFPATPLSPALESPSSPAPVASWQAWIGLGIALLAFAAMGDNRFTTLNITLWLLSILLILSALWQEPWPFRVWWSVLREWFRPPWSLKITPWALVLLAAAGLVIFFRIYRLGQVPPEMVSDQAEKLLDVWDVLHGQTSIFFPRNTGREAFQMYLTAAVIRVFGTGYSFLSLKIGTVLCGLLTLPFIYGLGKEAGSRRAGLFAMLMAGIAYWPNVISRLGLRFTLYPFFVAPVLYYLVRGLRTRNRNDFLLSGLFLGVGLHGYSPFRIVPLVVVAAFVIYVLHRQSQGARKQALWWLAALAAVSLLVFLPLLRFAFSNPDLFSYRAMTRLGSVEQPLPGNAWLIFLKNLWNALVMFAWDNGEVWVVSVTHRPALDIISGALFHLGVVWILLRYWRRRHWLDLFLLLSIPLLLLPSVLSLAFPNENPILNRTAGALVPIFVLVGLALEGLLAALEAHLPAWGARLGWGLAVLLVGLSALFNYDLVFNQYQRAYELSAWNTSEMGALIRDFGQVFGSTESAWVVAYPHWVDTRLVGMNAGEPTRDFAIWPEAFPETASDSRPKLFLLKPDDQAALDSLRQLYPLGTITVYASRVGEEKNFLIYLVPSSTSP